MGEVELQNYSSEDIPASQENDRIGDDGMITPEQANHVKTKAMDAIAKSIIKRSNEIGPECNEHRQFADPSIKAHSYVDSDGNHHGTLETRNGTKTTELRAFSTKYKGDDDSRRIISNKMWSNGTGSDFYSSDLDGSTGEISEETSIPVTMHEFGRFYGQGETETTGSAENAIRIFKEQREVLSFTERRVKSEKERIENAERMAQIIEQIKQDLPNIAHDSVPLDPQNDVIDLYGKSYTERAEYFRDNPDDYLQHSPKWHQHGILTHSYEFARAIKDTIPQYLEDWSRKYLESGGYQWTGLENEAKGVLSQQIDGVEKRQLLEVAGLLHDVGKFSSRTEEIEKDSIKSYSFTDHEEHSGKIIRTEDNVSRKLKDFGLTDAQIEYVARCAELHFELGKVRRTSKENGGYTMAFVDTPAFHDAAQEIIDKNPDFALEIGLLFIADGLSKSEVQAHGSTDEEIETETVELEKELAEKGLNPNLISQAKQMPVNFKIAKTYLNQWAETQ